MKGVVLFSLVLLLSASGQASECTSLFSNKTQAFFEPSSSSSSKDSVSKPYDDFMPALTSAETVLSWAYKSVDGPTVQPGIGMKTEEVALRELRNAYDVLFLFYNSFKNLRSQDENILAIEFKSKNFSAKNLERIEAVTSVVDARTANLLSARGVRLDFQNGSPIVSRFGDHYLNKLANRIYEKYKAEIIFDSKMLLSYGAAGAYLSPNIILSAKTIANRNIFQNEITLHEYTHHFDLNPGAMKGFSPNHVYIGIRKLPLELKNRYGIYKKGFSLDELKAYRASLRVMTHNALSEVFTNDAYEGIRKIVRSQIDFSELGVKVFSKAIDIPSSVKKVGSRTEEVIFSEREIYTIDKRTIRENREALRFADYNFQLYRIFDSKLEEYSNRSLGEKKQLIVKMNKVLSMREIRRMEEYYIPLEKIEEILE